MGFVFHKVISALFIYLLNLSIILIFSTLKHSFLGGGACTAAGFLSNFTNCPSWMHLDIAGVMDNTGGEVKYLSNGMSGRPTRTMVNFVENL